MGRPRKPTALKILAGDRADRINRDEPAPPVGLGEPPAFLDPVAKVAWARFAASMDGLGLLTVADREAAILYCTAFARWSMAEAAIADEGLTVTGQFGAKPNPHIAIADAAHKQMVRILIQFGMTPSSRSGLHVASPAESDPLLAFLAARKPAPHAQPQAQAKAGPKGKAKA